MATALLNIIDVRKEFSALDEKISALDAKQQGLQRQALDVERAISNAEQAYSEACRLHAEGQRSADPGGAMAQRDLLIYRERGLKQLLAAVAAELSPLAQQRHELAERIQRQAEADKLEELITDQKSKARAFEDAQRKLTEEQEAMWAANSAVAKHRKVTELDQRRRERGQ